METIVERWNDLEEDIRGALCNKHGYERFDRNVHTERAAALLMIAEKLDEQNKLLKEQNELTRQVIEGRYTK